MKQRSVVLTIITVICGFYLWELLDSGIIGTFALVSTEELQQLNQLLVKQLKNRYNDPTYYKRFTVGIDRSKMRLFDIEQSAQNGLADAGHNDKPLNTFGTREKPEKKFEGFKV